MKTNNVLFLIVVMDLIFSISWAQNASDLSVQITATIQTSPPGILFSWPLAASTDTMTIFRKTKNAGVWGAPLTILPGISSQYSDNTLNPGDEFEYRLLKTGLYTANTYLFAGMNAAPIEYRGKILLMTDDSFTVSLSAEISRLINDLEGDGWRVIHHTINRNQNVQSVKTILVNDFLNEPTDVKAVFLLGHIPVPYSGDINPDGHPDHLGAWPADSYYADINGAWSDLSVNDAGASRPENKNIPGDGKFDQSIIPSSLELQTGRVDFANMPAFTETEEDLLRQYLNRDHDYRHKKFAIRQRALIDDNFGYFSGEAFASSGWRNFSALFGADSVSSLDYFSTLDTAGYIFSYGCGGGTYTSCGGVGATTDCVSDSIQSVFTMLFGSYFGDWDSQNNFLKAPLASKGKTLASCWSGRPYWHFHHMGLGETIGYSTQLTQNNSNLYAGNYGMRFVHIGLMGDPTLRLHTLAPPDSLLIILDSVSAANAIVNLQWNASSESVDGYHVYRRDSSGRYIRINTITVSGLSYSDLSPDFGMTNYYMVRAIKLIPCASGSYFNLSQGIFNTADVPPSGIPVNESDFTLYVTPNPANNLANVYFSSFQKNSSLLISDFSGRIIFSQAVFSSPEIINLSDFSSGIYQLILKKEGTRKVKKLVVIK